MINSLRCPNIVVVGSVMVDLVTYAERIPNSGETVIGTTFSVGCGGKGANQAVIAHLLGGHISFVARVGDDHFGDMSLTNLSELGLDTSKVKRVEGVSTGVAPIWVTPDGRNRIIVVPGANARLAGVDARRQLSELHAMDAMVCQLELPLEVVQESLRIGVENDAINILNPAPADREAIPLFRMADWVIPNEHEFEVLSGDLPTDEAISTAAAEWGCGVVVTLGDQGAAVTTAEGVIRIQPPKVDVVDTTGAGDAFVGGFSFALAAGSSLHAAVLVGNTCGALSATKRGTQVSFPDRDAVELALVLGGEEFSGGSHSPV